MSPPIGPRRVLIVMPSLGRGGAERHAVNLATHLDPDRWRPQVLALADGPLHRELDDAGVPVTVVPTGRGWSALPAAAAAVATAIDGGSPDVVSAHDVMVEVVVRRAVRSRSVPLLAWKHTYGHVGYRGRRERLVETVSGGQVTRYGAVCHTQVRYLTDELGVDPRRTRVVPNSVPPRAVEPLPAGPPVVAMLAAMRADKGHRSALHAWSQVVETTPGARLLLAGDGPERPALEQLVRDLGLTESVELLGETGDAAAVLARAHALLVASYAVECFPYAALEAMALGRAVVSTDTGGLPELVEDGVSGLLVPPHDAIALAHALTWVVSDFDRARRLGEAGRDRLARAFPFDRWVDQVHDLLDETATGRRTHTRAPAVPRGARP